MQPVTDSDLLTPTGAQAYTTASRQETEGIGLELASVLASSWDVYAGYIYLHFRRFDSDGRSGLRQ